MAGCHVAIDIGASSGRHIVGQVVDGRMELTEVYRFENGLTRKDGHLCWEIDALAAELEYAVGTDFQQPANFYGVGGMKIFRDLIFTMQGMMREDHRFYKSHGFYDFPQKRKGMILGMYLVGAMLNNEKLNRKIGANMTKGMLMPYQSVIKKAKPEKSRLKKPDKLNG